MSTATEPHQGDASSTGVTEPSPAAAAPAPPHPIARDRPLDASSARPSAALFLPSKASLEPTASTTVLTADRRVPYSSSLGQKFGKFLGSVLASPSPTSAARAGPAERRDIADRAGRRGWVDLVPSEAGPTLRSPNIKTNINNNNSTNRTNTNTNPFVVQSAAPSSSTGSTTTPGSLTQPIATASTASSSSSSAAHSLKGTSIDSPSHRIIRRPPLSTAVSSATAGPSSPQTPTGPGSSPVAPLSRRRPSWLRPARPEPMSTPSPGKWRFSMAVGLSRELPSHASMISGETTPSKGKQRHSVRDPIEGIWTREGSLEQTDLDAGREEDEGYWEGEDCYPSFDIIASLPTELALYIYLFLPASSLTTCLTVNKSWHALASDNLIWRALFDSHQHWRLRPTYLRALEPIPTPVPSRPPSPASLFSTLSISSHPPPTPRHPDGSLNLLQTPLRRPAYKSRTSTATSVSKIQLFSPTHPSSHLPYIDWKKMYQKRAWLDARWGKEQYGQEKVFEGHEDSVYCLQMDGVKLVTGSRDKTIKIWSLSSGKCLETIKAHDASVLCLVYDEETGFMVSGGSDSRIVVWDMHGPGLPSRPIQKKIVLTGHTQGVLDVALSDDYIVSCSKDTTILVHSRHTLEHVHTLSGHAGPVNAIGLHADRLASASGDAKIRVWNLVSGQCEKVFEGHERGLACVEFKGEYVVSGSNDKTVKLWNVSGECLKTMSGHTDLVRTLAFDPSSGRIVSAGYDKQILIWDFEGKIVSTLESSHTSLVFDVRFDAGRIVSASHDQTVRIHDFGDDETRLMFC